MEETPANETVEAVGSYESAPEEDEPEMRDSQVLSTFHARCIYSCDKKHWVLILLQYKINLSSTSVVCVQAPRDPLLVEVSDERREADVRHDDVLHYARTLATTEREFVIRGVRVPSGRHGIADGGGVGEE